jgi:RND family efflux transporter MFP subunit
MMKESLNNLARGRRMALIAIGLLVYTSVPAQDPVPVQVAQPEVRPAVERIDLIGTFTAHRSAPLSPSLSGLVDSIGVDAGDTVSEGEVIVQLDDRLAEMELAEVEASVSQARAALDEATRLLDEALRLSEGQVIPATEIEARRSSVQVAEAQLNTALARRDTAAERLAQHAIVAPFSGVIARRLTESGEWVQTGTAVVELVSVADLWLDIQAPQRLWPKLREDTDVTVVVDALEGASFLADVAARVPVSNPDARTFLLRLVLPQADPDITPGMSARAHLSLSTDADALLVPRDALLRFPDGTTTLFIVDTAASPARARQREVSVGRIDGEWAVIEKGIIADQAVVVRGNELLRDGDAVRLVDSDISPDGI